jgi:hypothetical protein
MVSLEGKVAFISGVARGQGVPAVYGQGARRDVAAGPSAYYRVVTDP